MRFQTEALPLFPARPRPGGDGNVNVVPEQEQKTQKALDGKVGQTAPHQRGYLGLVHAEYLCRLHLGQPTAFDDVNDAVSQIGLRARLLRMADAEIDIDVPATFDVLLF